ncbi:MAG: dihydrolipoyl dehydrogenase [FCB group bacterium]|nr:dihydrolipoyl dehydrogenase [FCB group bacterium]
MKKYDIVIIGAGPGGYTAAIRAALKGAKVAVVEEDALGGVCLNRGCIPSKTLIAGANLYQKMKSAASFGITLECTPTIDWPAMLARKDKVVGGMVAGIKGLFKNYGVDHFSGFGSLKSSKVIHLDLDDESEEDIEAANVIIATGSRPAIIPAFPLDGLNVLSSDHLLTMEKLPSSMLIIGAGVIGCEWAFMLAQLDVKVEIVEMLSRSLPMEDAMASNIITRELKKLKVKLHTDSKVEKLANTASGLIGAVLSDSKTLEAEKILVSIGRAFNTADLGLDNAGVTLNENGSIKVNAGMQTSAKNVYAIGDVAGGILLAYTAVAEGAVAVDNCLGAKAKIDYTGVPSVIFTRPEVASVGLTEEKAAEKHDIAIGSFPIRALGKAHAEGEISGEVKVIGDKKTDKLLGVHIVGPHATEVIHTAALAIKTGLTVEKLGSLTFAHPVISESVMEACHNLHKMSVHLPGQR